MQGYIRGKLRSDPAYAAAAREIHAAPAPVLDIGSGIGLLGHYLRDAGHTQDYLGLDLDADKIAIAKRAAAHSRALRFLTGSCETLPDWQGHVVLLDVLHYLSAEQQQAVLRAAADRVALTVETPGGPDRMQADWLPAADGARSTIRPALGLAVAGQVVHDRFLSAHGGRGGGVRPPRRGPLRAAFPGAG